MKAAEVSRNGAAMEPLEERKQLTAAHAALPASTTGRDLVARRVEATRLHPSLVTLKPAGSELNPKQILMAEQFRLLRTRVKALSKDFQLRTILVTSALPGEGKTLISANLAGSLSRIEGLRVLLIDFDLRRPSLHTLFGVETDRRKSSSFAGDSKWQLSLYQVNPRLDVLFGFLPLEEPDGLLQSTRLETLLAEAKAEYDVVILDSAPLLAVADTQSLVPLVDCGLFILKADSTPIGIAKDGLAMMRDKVAGCIVNRVQKLKTEEYYRNFGYAYGYGYKSLEK